MISILYGHVKRKKKLQKPKTSITKWALKQSPASKDITFLLALHRGNMAHLIVIEHEE
jgi:hypothetical protein